MSWDWTQEKESKEYETKGLVTISTEEYRDLITEVQVLRSKGQREHDDWYNEYNRSRQLDAEVKSLKAKIEEIEQWFDDFPEQKAIFKQWKFNKQEEENE